MLSYRSQPSFGIVCGKMCQVKFFFLLSPPFVSPHGFNPVQVCSSDFSSPQEIKKISQIRQVANNLCRAAECQIFSSVPEAVGDLIDCDTICALDWYSVAAPLACVCCASLLPANSAEACRAERFESIFILWLVLDLPLKDEGKRKKEVLWIKEAVQ